jgi:hypothetical protein
VASIGTKNAASRKVTPAGGLSTLATRDSPAPAGPVYAPPAILWEEDYEAVALALSCVKFEGDEGCLPGPLAW